MCTSLARRSHNLADSDKSSVDEVRVVYVEIHKPFICIFPEVLRIAKITPTFKKGGTVYLTNYSPMHMIIIIIVIIIITIIIIFRFLLQQCFQYCIL